MRACEAVRARVCLSSFFAQANDLIAKILVVEPEKRLSLRGISQHPWMMFGEESVPRLEAIDLILSHSTDVEMQWRALCKAVTDLQVVYTVPIDRCAPHFALCVSLAYFLVRLILVFCARLRYL